MTRMIAAVRHLMVGRVRQRGRMVVAAVIIGGRRSLMRLLTLWLREVIVELAVVIVVVAVALMRRLLLMGVGDGHIVMAGAETAGSTARARRQLLRGDGGALNFGAAEARAAALVVRRGRGAREGVEGGVGASGIAAVAARLALHQKIVVIVDVIGHDGAVARGEVGLIGATVGSTAVAGIVGHHG